MKTFILLSLLFFFLFVNNIFTREFRINQIPNGNKLRCSNCHISSNGGGSLNAFGTEVRNNFLTSKNSNGNVIWNAALASKDSDKDGFTNGQELGDPLGLWKIGNPNPGNSDDVSNPGSPNSKPTNVEENNSINQISNDLQINSLYPNPMINKATLIYNLKHSEFVSISLYDYNGNFVKCLFYGFQNSGIQNFIIDANVSENKDLGHGLYMLVIKSGTISLIEKLIIK
jgi:hypothetical protein